MSGVAPATATEEKKKSTKKRKKKAQTPEEQIRSIKTLLFCAKQEELSILIQKLQIPTDLGEINAKVDHIDSRRCAFYFGKVRILVGDRVKPVSFYACCGSHQGPVSSGITLAYLLERYKPKYVISVGICGGIVSSVEGEVQLGDVVFACKAMNYEAGKYESNGELKLDMDAKSAANGMENDAKRLIENEHHHRWMIGTMIIGSAVRKDAVDLVAKHGKSLPRDIKAIDMEASTIFEVCHFFGVEAMPVIKSISDMANQAKNDNLHERCLMSAGRAALEFLKAFHSLNGKA